ncbi:MAG TPA: hypothetical protein VF092_09865 [Longimicrobium sp.]
MDRNAEIELLREALRRRVETTSVRQVAAEVKMSHGAIFNLVSGQAVPRGKTLVKLRAWYVEQSASGGMGLTMEAARFLVDQMLGAVPAYMRRAAGVELLVKLEGVYQLFGVPIPSWLTPLRKQLEE